MQKSALIALAIIATVATGAFFFRRHIHVAKPEGLKQVYNQWKVDYQINVGAAEDDYRFKVFSENYEKIVNHNKLLGKSYTLGLNAFTHLTQAEFAATHLGFIAPSSSSVKNTVALPLKAEKADIDWTPKLNPVKDQGQCGSCWAFSTVGSVEGLHSVQAGQLYDLSEQELVDCSGSFGNQGCNGGLMDQGFQYVASVGGLASEQEYPYVAADGTCKTNLTRQGKISSFVDVPQNSSDALKAAVAKQPVSVAVEADTFAFQGYNGGVVNDNTCGTNLDHGVVVVGYNDQVDTPYYKVRNSWGPKWGEAGYIRLAIIEGSGPGMCGIQMSASYPTL